MGVKSKLLQGISSVSGPIAIVHLSLSIRQLCAPDRIVDFERLIDSTINEDITWQSQPLDLRNQRTYAIKVAQHLSRQLNSHLTSTCSRDRTDYSTSLDKHTKKQMSTLINWLQTLVVSLCSVYLALINHDNCPEQYELALEMKYDPARQYYIRIAASELEEREHLPDIFINQFRRKTFIECQTLDLLKWNQKIADSHHEVVQMSDKTIQELIDQIRADIAPLFKICEAISLLDMMAAFAQLVTTQDYCRPELTNTLAIKSGRHPIREKSPQEKFVPNDAYATQQSRFQIITGCNMSGKSTYIRSLALMAIMAQIGSFVPATYASFPIFHQLFARVSMDDSIEANVSTFAAEMRETAFILRNVDERSMVIIDELGRGTSTRDGLCIAIAIAEALVSSRALVWFVTHFRDLAKILAERNGVVNLHLAVEMGEADSMTMLYKISNGCVSEEHYGIALAKVVGLPSRVIETAEEVSDTLTRNMEKRKKGSKAVALARRRKLVLGLREQLEQAKEGNMQGKVLGAWMKKLQDEFVTRMSAIDAEVAAASEDDSEDEKADTEDQVSLVRDRSQGASRSGSADGVHMMTGALQADDSEASSSFIR